MPKGEPGNKKKKKKNKGRPDLTAQTRNGATSWKNAGHAQDAKECDGMGWGQGGYRGKRDPSPGKQKKDGSFPRADPPGPLRKRREKTNTIDTRPKPTGPGE